MLKEENKQEVIKRLGLNEDAWDKIVEAVTSEEERQIELPQMHYFTPEEFQKFKEDTKTKKRPAWIEESVKTFRQENDLKLESDTIESLFEAGKQAGLKEGEKEPSEKLNEMKKKLDLALNDIEKLENEKKTLHQKSLMAQRRSQLIGKIDFNTNIDKDKIFSLYTMDFELGSDDDGDLRTRKVGAESWMEDERYNKVNAEDHFLKYAESFKANGSIRKPDTDDDFDAENPVFKSKRKYDKWVESEKPDRQTAGKVLIASVEKNPQFYEN